MRKGLSCQGKPHDATECVYRAARDFFSCLFKDREEGAVEPVIVGFSGGVDSTVLLHVLYELGSELGLQPVAAHLNHKLRGEDSNIDEDHCRTFCEKRGIPFRSRSVDVAELALKSGLNLEDAGRRGRYSLYQEVAEEFGARYAALAHHADDQAETVLMRIIRGTGTRGMGAMSKIRRSGNIDIVRPLISVRKADVAAFAAERQLEYKEDASNLDTGYLRNKVRHELLPLLEKEYSPGIVDVLCRTAELAREESSALDELGMAAFKDALKKSGEGRRIVIDLDKLSSLAPAVMARALRTAYAFVKGSASDLYASNQSDLLSLASSTGRAKELDLPGNVKAKRSGRELAIAMSSAAGQEAKLKAASLTVPGMSDTPLMKIRAASLDIPEKMSGKRRFTHSELALLACSALGQGYANECGAGSTWAVFDLEQAGELSIRAWEPGDTIIPFGMKGKRKLQDVFTDEKVPKDKRRLWPVITIGDGSIAWIPGIRQGSAAKLGAYSKLALVLAAELKGEDSP